MERVKKLNLDGAYGEKCDVYEHVGADDPMACKSDLSVVQI
jgi:hypothetical protein